jgi:hypothetical protein
LSCKSKARFFNASAVGAETCLTMDLTGLITENGDYMISIPDGLITSNFGDINYTELLFSVADADFDDIDFDDDFLI